MKNPLPPLGRTALFIILAAAAADDLAAVESVTIHVQIDRPGARINPAMWGVFFEDINLGADGGLYAELVKNRSFEFPNAMMGWNKITRGPAKGSLSVQ